MPPAGLDSAERAWGLTEPVGAESPARTTEHRQASVTSCERPASDAHRMGSGGGGGIKLLSVKVAGSERSLTESLLDVILKLLSERQFLRPNVIAPGP